MCEQLDEHEVLGEVLSTLRTIFQETEIPEPTFYQITKWGSDKYARGSYTYLPPGCTDQDFHVLQAAINGNGDSTVLETAETYRVFFAGEHTTALHPSMAHGAMLSGLRAAKEVVTNMTHGVQPDTSVDRTIPLSTFRYQFPNAALVCCLCGDSGSNLRQGSLLAFKRGPRAIVVHNNCAEYSPEVEVLEGVWKYVFQACNRGRDVACDLCGKLGATIGCSGDSRCYRSYHFSCAEDTGFRFDTDSDGKEFFCDLHRRGMSLEKESRRISVDYFSATNYDDEPMTCYLCEGGKSRDCGELLGYQQYRRRCLIHQNCAKYTTIASLSENSSSRLTQDYRNVFSALDLSTECTSCGRQGATVGCCDDSCQNYYHFPCALGLKWNFEKRPRFRCPTHRQKRPSAQQKQEGNESSLPTPPAEFFQHALFSHLAGDSQVNAPANEGVGAPDIEVEKSMDEEDDYSSDEDTTEASSTQSFSLDPMTQSLQNMSNLVNGSRLVGIQRDSVDHLWNIFLSLSRDKLRDMYFVSFAKRYQSEDGEVIEKGEVLVAINGVRIGMQPLGCLQDVLGLLQQEVELLVEVQKGIPDAEKQ